jgi:hypothetical protein
VIKALFSPVPGIILAIVVLVGGFVIVGHYDVRPAGTFRTTDLVVERRATIQDLQLNPSEDGQVLPAGSNNNLALTGWADHSIFEIIPDASNTTAISGMAALGDGEVRHIHNFSTTATMSFHSLDSNSVAANQMYLPDNTTVTVPPFGSVTFHYDAGVGKWVALAIPNNINNNITGTTNTIAKFTSAHVAGDAAARDNGSTFTIGGAAGVRTVAIGDVTSQELINGPTLQSFAIPSTAYGFGEVNRIEIQGVVPAFPADLFALVLRDSAVADTTTHSQHSGAIAAEVTSTRTAGGNDLINTAIECTASGGQVNECLHVLGGDIVIDGGGNLLQNSGFAFLAGSFVAAGNTFFAEGNGTNAIDISGAPTNAIHTRQAAAQFDINNAVASTLTFYNSNFGRTQIEIGIGSTPSAGPKLSAGVPTVDHGTIQSGSTSLAGDVTGVGAFTTVTLTYPVAFPNRSWCRAQLNTDTIVGQYIIVVDSASAPTFNCKLAGVASNCNDFSWSCVGE